MSENTFLSSQIPHIRDSGVARSTYICHPAHSTRVRMSPGLHTSQFFAMFEYEKLTVLILAVFTAIF